MKTRETKLQSFKKARSYPSMTQGCAIVKTNVRNRFMPLALVTVVILALAVPVAAGAQEILPGPSTSLPVYIGAPAEAHPLPPVQIPQNPFLALNPWNNVHNDAWMSDVYNVAGPLGRSPAMLTSRLEAARRLPASPSFICGALTFDSRGRIVTTCGSPNRTGESSPESSLVLIDPLTLEVLASEYLDVTSSQEAAYGSSYMYLDNRDRAVVTVTDRVLVFEQKGQPGHLRFKKVEDYDLSAWVGANDNIQTVMPDWQGRLWFVVRHSGLVGVLNPDTGAVGSLKLCKDPTEPTACESEEIANSFPFIKVAANVSDAFVVTTKAMYRLRAGSDGVPHILWRSEYKNFGGQKPGQLSAGSGTSPTLLDGGKYVAITDNDDQMQIVVYRTAVDLGPKEERVVCEVPVFEPGAGATEDSLIGLGRSMIVANQYVYTDGKTAPGIARVDIDAKGKGCRLVWANDEIAAPQVGPKMSTETGLAYFYTKRYDVTGLDVYYWTAVDFRTGKIVWEQQIGTGSQFDTYVPGPAIGPTGALYVGVNGGFISMQDTD